MAVPWGLGIGRNWTVLVAAYRTVPDRVDIVGAGASVIVDDYVAPAGLDACCLHNCRVGANAGGQDDDVSL